MNWQYDEFQQVGKDYGQKSEVEVYDSSHSDFRDIEKESLEVFEKIQLGKKDILVDFGCGTGTFAILAAQRCTYVYAADISSAMLDHAKKKASERGVKNIDFLNTGFLNYEHKGKAPTVVSSTFAFHHLPDFWKGVALKRIHKTLAQGGRFYLCDVILDEEEPLEKISRFIEKQDQVGGDFLREDAEQHFREEYSTYDWVIDGMLQRSGFKIESKEKQEGIIATYVCSK